MFSLFAAIRPPDNIIDEISSIQTGIEGINWIIRDNLHITLGYFGQIGDEKAEMLDREIAKNPGPAFELRLSGIGTFGGGRIHTIWAGLETSEALHDLHKYIRRAARISNVAMEARKYVPHLSLAYPRGHIDKAALARYIYNFAAFRSSRFLVDEFALYSSHRHKTGPNTYIKQADYPLKPPAF